MENLDEVTSIQTNDASASKPQEIIKKYLNEKGESGLIERY